MEDVKNQDLVLYNQVVDMKRNGKTKAEIKLSLTEQGIDEVKCNEILGNVYRYDDKIKSSESSGNIGWGLFLILVGVIATSASDGHTVFYGAILVGIYKLFKGFSQN
ncbi:hypothetical protein [Flavobacterium sp.]|uniref:hypothetical protein n=1 Tax=Flavobacterium sp. TaxID=239 RepID=UPI0026230C73|nr:hypothetical protein [Flavobacterium sp.]